MDVVIHLQSLSVAERWKCRFKWKLWNIVSRSQHLRARAGTQYVRLLCMIVVQHLYALVAFSLGVGLTLFPEARRALLQKTILFLVAV